MTTNMTADVDGAVARLFALDQDLINDPYPVYARMRAEQPVMRVGSLVAVSRYEDVKAVLRDTETFSSSRSLGSRETERRQQLGPDDLEKFEFMTSFEGRSLTQAVNPEHARIRRFVNATFASSSIANLRDEVVAIVDDLLDRADASPQDGTFDLIGEFSYLLRLEVVCRLLGVKDVEVSTVRAWAKEIRKGIGTTYSNLDDAYDALQNYRAYVTQVIREQRDDPAGATPLFAQLISTDEAGTSLSEDDLVSIFIQMMTSGNTNDLIANSVLALHEHPEQWRFMSENTDKVRGAVEELFRYCPSIHAIHRVATRDCEVGASRSGPARRSACCSRRRTTTRRSSRTPGRWTSPARTPASTSGSASACTRVLASGWPARRPRSR